MKRKCALAALELIHDGMIVGLGGGETIGYLVDDLSHSKKKVHVVTPSFVTEQACLRAGLSVLPLWSVSHVDIAFDGCDEVDSYLNALKSGGAIHTREKLVAAMSDRYILLIDESKYYEELPFKHDVTCEIFKEAYSYVSSQIERLGGHMLVRQSQAKAGPTISDDGHFIVDVHFDKKQDPRSLNEVFHKMQGVIETSLFIDLVTDLIVSTKEGLYRIGGK